MDSKFCEPFSYTLDNMAAWQQPKHEKPDAVVKIEQRDIEMTETDYEGCTNKLLDTENVAGDEVETGIDSKVKDETEKYLKCDDPVEEESEYVYVLDNRNETKTVERDSFKHDEQLSDSDKENTDIGRDENENVHVGATDEGSCDSGVEKLDCDNHMALKSYINENSLANLHGFENESIGKLVGASKRKGNLSIEKAISQITQVKTVCRDKMDCLNAFDEEKTLVIDELKVGFNVEKSVPAEEKAVFEIKHERSLEGARHNLLHGKVNGIENDSLHMYSRRLEREVGRKNKRKNSVPARCQGSTENNQVSDHTKADTKVNESVIHVPNIPQPCVPDCLDLSVQSNSSSLASSNTCITNSGNIVGDGPIDLSKAGSKKEEHPDDSQNETKMEPIDLSFKSSSARNGQTQMKRKLEDDSHSQNLFLDWINNSPNKDVMQANLLQFQMWMQNAANRNSQGEVMWSENPLGANLNGIKMEKNLLENNLRKGFNHLNTDFLAFRNLPLSYSPGTYPITSSPMPRKRVKLNDSNQDVPDQPDKIIPVSDDFAIEGVKGMVEDGGTMKFYVTENKQIQTIVDYVIDHSSINDDQVADNTEMPMKFKCRICQSRFFHLEHLSKHVKNHHIMKKYKCSQCEKSFLDAGNYRQHMRVHDENDIPYECPECNRRFRHKCTLKVHMRIHTGEKPFTCNICGAAFKISSGLQTHMRKHTGETPYACEYCSMRFKCQSNLKQHLFQHTQARPFPCEICGKSYSRKSIRDTHMQTHHRNGHVTFSQAPIFG